MPNVCPVSDVFEKSDWKREGWEKAEIWQLLVGFGLVNSI
jgi:hypothetical protein